MMSETRSLLGPAARFLHRHAPIRNPIAEHEEHLSHGQRIADKVATALGSWPFIIIQSALLAAWILLNVWFAVRFAQHRAAAEPWDPYPFILLNLMLSFQAAYTGPVVMMSQNRQSEKDRLMAQNDYEINQKAEEEIKVLMDHLVHQDELLIQIVQRLEGVGSAEVQEQIQTQLAALQRSDEDILKRLQKEG